MSESIEELKAEIERLKKCLAYSEKKVDNYENGDSKLYYAVKRKMSELGSLLNLHDMSDISLSDKDSKAFERVSAILEKCEKYAISASALGVRSGIESIKQPEENKPFVETIAETRR